MDGGCTFGALNVSGEKNSAAFWNELFWLESDTIAFAYILLAETSQMAGLTSVDRKHVLTMNLEERNVDNWLLALMLTLNH